LDEVNQLTEKAKSKYISNINQNGKKDSIDFPLMKNLANIFVGLMLILLIVVILTFIPLYSNYCLKNSKLKTFNDNKIKIKNIPNIFTDIDTLSKVLFRNFYFLFNILFNKFYFLLKK
jgi:hypothetical protein